MPHDDEFCLQGFRRCSAKWESAITKPESDDEDLGTDLYYAAGLRLTMQLFTVPFRIFTRPDGPEHRQSRGPAATATLKMTTLTPAMRRLPVRRAVNVTL